MIVRCLACRWAARSATLAGARLLADHHVDRFGPKHNVVVEPD